MLSRRRALAKTCSWQSFKVLLLVVLLLLLLLLLLHAALCLPRTRNPDP